LLPVFHQHAQAAGLWGPARWEAAALAMCAAFSAIMMTVARIASDQHRHDRRLDIADDCLVA
jgi:hypothetical protein